MSYPSVWESWARDFRKRLLGNNADIAWSLRPSCIELINFKWKFADIKRNVGQIEIEEKGEDDFFS